MTLNSFSVVHYRCAARYFDLRGFLTITAFKSYCISITHLLISCLRVNKGERGRPFNRLSPVVSVFSSWLLT